MAAKKTASKQDNSVETTVFVPIPSSGGVPKQAILATAIESVRDAIPVVYTLDPEITKVSDRKTVEGTEGRDYTVTVRYSAEGVADAEPVDVDRVVKSMEVPTLSDFAAATEASGTA